MDPLSISAAVVSFLTFSGATARLARRLIHDASHAPKEIISLSNQVCDLNVTLADFEATAATVAQSPSNDRFTTDFKARLDAHLARARDKIRELETLLQEVYIIAPNTPPKFLRYQWIRKKNDALELLKSLMVVKEDFRLLLGQITVAQTVQIQLSLTSLQSGAVQSPTGAVVEELEDGGNGNLQVVQEILPANLAATQELTSPDDVVAKLLQIVKQVGTFATLNLQLHRIIKCDGKCLCQCHNRTFLHSPNLLNGLFGSLFVGYAGLPVWRQKCDVVGCMNQYTRTMQVSYSFPNWLLSKTLHMVFAMTQSNEPSFGFKMKHRVSNMGENNIFQLARGGHTQAIVELFKTRQASPNDISRGDGTTPIGSARELGKIETMKLLLDAGVDPYNQDDVGNTDALHISELVLTPRRRHAGTTQDGLEDVFTKMGGHHDEIWDFSVLHRIVVKDLHVDLDEALQNPDRRAEINVRDIRNRTPLLWAAMRGDENAVRSLIKAGADVNIKDDGKLCPLLAAVVSGSLGCTEQLILGGGDINSRDSLGHNALHCASWAVDDPALLRLLLLAGASVNSTCYRKTSAIQSCACLNNYRNGAYLIDMGAIVDTRDKDNDTPLLEAVRYDSIEMVRILLDNGADYKCVNDSRETILHLAATYANKTCIELLLEYDLRGLSTRAGNVSGKTAVECFEGRLYKPDGLTEAFDQLIAKLEGTDSDSDEDTFWDAMAEVRENPVETQ